MGTVAQPESKFLTVNGLRLHYLDWGNSGAPPLVCVHGLRGSAHMFDGFARRFRDRYHILSFDVRGRGDSGWSPEGAYQFTDYVSERSGPRVQQCRCLPCGRCWNGCHVLPWWSGA